MLSKRSKFAAHQYVCTMHGHDHSSLASCWFWSDNLGHDCSDNQKAEEPRAANGPSHGRVRFIRVFALFDHIPKLFYILILSSRLSAVGSDLSTTQSS